MIDVTTPTGTTVWVTYTSGRRVIIATGELVRIALDRPAFAQVTVRLGGTSWGFAPFEVWPSLEAVERMWATRALTT